MILSEKDLQLLSSMPTTVPEPEKRENDLKIGEYYSNFSNIIHLIGKFLTFKASKKLQSNSLNF